MSCLLPVLGIALAMLTTPALAPADGQSSPPPSAAPTPAQSPAPTPEPEPARPKWWGPFPRPAVTGFGGPLVHLTGANRAFAALVGLAGGITIRQRVSIGAAALWLLNPIDAGTNAVGSAQQLNLNFGGLHLAVVVARTKRLDFSLTGLFAGGGACLQNPRTGTCNDRTAMFVGQPGLDLHIRLAPVVRLVVGAGYRLVAARSWTGPRSLSLAAPAGTVMLEFGWF